VQDIEDLCALGKKHSTCPYYAARGAVANAQVCDYREQEVSCVSEVLVYTLRDN
jgi:hypothetical protein